MARNSGQRKLTYSLQHNSAFVKTVLGRKYFVVFLFTLTLHIRCYAVFVLFFNQPPSNLMICPRISVRFAPVAESSSFFRGCKTPVRDFFRKSSSVSSCQNIWSVSINDTKACLMDRNMGEGAQPFARAFKCILCTPLVYHRQPTRSN